MKFFIPPPSILRLLTPVLAALAVASAAVQAAVAPADPVAGVNSNAFVSLRLAIQDLMQSFPEKYPHGAEYLGRLDELGRRFAAGAPAQELREPLDALRRQALLENPLLDFDRLLLVKRADPNCIVNGQGLGLPQNWQGTECLHGAYDNEIAVLAPARPEGRLATLFRPEKKVFVGDMNLHFDADRLMFAMPAAIKPGDHAQFHVWELRVDGTELRRLTPDEPDVDHYDPCYLPDGRILFVSTAGFQGVPCVGGGDFVGNLQLMASNGAIRQICYDQEHNWCPTVLNDGRVMYSRWEYTDTPHYLTRVLFGMNPDGTGQSALYGSNSSWPNGIFYARPVPGHPSLVVGVISGHHGVPRMGELILFDLAKGRHKADGVVQRIPGRGLPVEPVIKDQLVTGSWPKFLHPCPLNDKYFIVACKPTPTAWWGIYLVDVFDNMVLLREEPGWALFEPAPLRPTPRPPVIPDRVRPDAKDATVYMADVYTGPGLAGVPRGTVKSLRVFEYHFAYRHMGGHINIGIDGPWDVHRILGTVPVSEDGSAFFQVPPNTPLAVQPLDAQGRALQIMRSWFTAQPGERLSCIGCHENANEVAPPRINTAARAAPVEIAPWLGPARGFSFPRDVQPVLDRRCVGCHDGRMEGRPDFRPGRTEQTVAGKKKSVHQLPFDLAYLNLHPYVRRPGPECGYDLQMPCEFFAETSELIQMLRKGHHGVKLDNEEWSRLITWIDLNVPDHGTWGEHRPVPNGYHEKRLAMRKLYSNVETDPEVIPPAPSAPAFVAPAPGPAQPSRLGRLLGAGGAPTNFPGWPFAAAEARRLQSAAGFPPKLTIALAPSNKLELVLIPAGSFPMGDAAGAPDERPVCRVKIARPFYLAKFEVCNEQYQLFDPTHDSGVAHYYNKDHVAPGVPCNRPRQPVIRVSWQQAQAFCAWLSQKTGRRFSLPTEAQWEWACRAGTATPLNYGALDADFGRLANLADASLETFTPRNSPKWIPRITNVNDGAAATCDVGRYLPNAWGLYDMHGNAAEWTRSTYRPYPYRADDGRDNGDTAGLKVVRGGSYYDRPFRAESAFRLAYASWQGVYNVGFRVALEP